MSLALFDMLPEWRSPLTPGVQSANLSQHPDSGTLRVDLGNNWARMLTQLPAVGFGLVMARNEAAILGRYQSYPTLQFTTAQTKGASAEAGLWLDCRALGAGYAVHTRSEFGNVFGVEITNVAGITVHRFTLTPESNLEEFCGWVRLHQACPSPGTSPTVVDDEGGCRFEDLRPGEQRSDAGALIAVMNACLQHEIAVRATVLADGVRQRAVFTPRSLQPADDWWFASDDNAGLHFHTGKFSRVSVAPLLGNERHVAPVIYAEIAGQTPALILELGNTAQVSEWSAIVRYLA